MRVINAHVQVYKSIDDSGPVPIDREVTVVVGQNESGKTAFLEALHKSRSVEEDVGFDITEDYPRKALNRYRKEHETSPAVVTTLTFELSREEAQQVNDELGVSLVKEGFTFTRAYRYGGSSTIGLSLPEKEYIRHRLKGVELPSEVAKQASAASTLRGLIDVLKEADLNEEAAKFRDRLTAMFGKAPSTWHNVLAWWVWDNLIATPKFMYFDDYKLLPGKVNLAQLQRRKNQNGLEDEDKTAIALLRMADVDLDDLLRTKAYEEVKARLEGLSNSITDQIFEYWRQNRELDVEFDIRDDPTDEPPFNNGPNLYIRIRSRRHRVTVPFSQRSKGFIWFFSFLVWFDSVKEQAGTRGDLVLLLDEPGLSLHGLAQADLLRYIDNLAQNHQVIYTTHSPFMVRSDRLHQVRVVEDRKDEGTKVSENVTSSDRATLFPLQAALGYDVAQNLFIGKRNLLVEGPADLVYLKFFDSQIEANGGTALRGDITVVPVGGLDKVATFVALLGASELQIAVLHDSIGRPDRRIQEVVREKLIKEKQVLNYGMFRDGGKKGDAAAADVEDLFTPSTYLGLFSSAFKKELGGREIDENELPAGDRIVDRINRFLAAEGIEVRPSGGFNHYRVANHLASQPKAKIDAATVKRFARLFDAVNGVFASG